MSHGYSAGVWRTFPVHIINENNIGGASDAIQLAIDAFGGGHCISCNKIHFEKEKPATWAVMARARGGEEPRVAGFCNNCSRRYDHIELWHRAQKYFASP